jgi:uncharacterized membrane protein YbhN (UPF0104 family)
MATAGPQTTGNGQPSAGKVLRLLTPKRLIWPIIIGLAVVTYMFVVRFDQEAFRQINWHWNSALFLLLAFASMAIRDAAYMYRIRLLTNGELAWSRSLGVALLWEFGSAATPSSVGGSPLAIFLLRKSGLSTGRSAAIVMFCIFLDGLFFVVFIPILYLAYGEMAVRPEPGFFPDAATRTVTEGLLVACLVSFCALALWTAVLGYGLFVNPKGIQRLLFRLFSLRFLSRWKRSAVRAGSDLILASRDIRTRHASYWIKAFATTVLSWSGRFTVAILLLLIISPATLDYLHIYGRQMVMQTMLMSVPTPGGSGVAELSLPAFLVEYVPTGLEATLSLLWRAITYYIYLFIGVYLLPRWIKRMITTAKT